MSSIRSLRSGDRPPSRRVLVVEDNLDTVHSMTRLIKLMGHECQFAINGFAALDIAREFKPEIILLDIGLPDFPGYDVARQLRYEPGLENTRIIAVSGRPESDRGLAIDAGCDEFYRKPVEIELLESLLEARFGVSAFAPTRKASE